MYLTTQHVLTKCPADTRVGSEQTGTRDQQGVQLVNKYPWTIGCAASKQVPVDNRVCSEETGTRGQQGTTERSWWSKRTSGVTEVLTNSSSSELTDMVSPASRSANSSPRCIEASRMHTGRQPSRGTQHTTPHGRLRAAQCPPFTHDNVLASHKTVPSPHTRRCPRLTHDSVLASHKTVSSPHTRQYRPVQGSGWRLSRVLNSVLKLQQRVTGPEQCAQTAAASSRVLNSVPKLQQRRHGP